MLHFIKECVMKAIEEHLAQVAGDTNLSDWIRIYSVDTEKKYTISGEEHFVGAGFQPSVLMDSQGTIHVFFQARMDSSEDETEKMIGHVTSEDGGKTFSDMSFVNPVPLFTYAISSFEKELADGTKRICLLTCLSMAETVTFHKDPAVVKDRTGIDLDALSRKAGCVVLEFFSDDFGKTWSRKEHWGITDREYDRNARTYYLSFFNMIGQVRRIKTGPFAGRMIIGGPTAGEYLPFSDEPHFRKYRMSSSIVYSDDNGESWHFGGVVNDEHTFRNSEASAVPVEEGKKIMLIRRRQEDGTAGKLIHYSEDGGENWSHGRDCSIPAVHCLHVLEKVGETVLCSSPRLSDRTQGCIYMSRNYGRSWTVKCIEPDLFSYSTVQHLIGKYYMCCFSLKGHGSKGLASRIFHADWLESGTPGIIDGKMK